MQDTEDWSYRLVKPTGCTCPACCHLSLSLAGGPLAPLRGCHSLLAWTCTSYAYHICARTPHTMLLTAGQAWMRQLGLGSKPRPAAGGGTDRGADKTSLAAAALAAAKAAASAAGAARMGGTVTVQEQRRFAGQTITVNKEVAAGSKEAQKAAAEAEAAARKKAGLDAVLASLQQAKKVGAGWVRRAPAPHAIQSTGRLRGRPRRSAASCVRR